MDDVYGTIQQNPKSVFWGAVVILALIVLIYILSVSLTAAASKSSEQLQITKTPWKDRSENMLWGRRKQEQMNASQVFGGLNPAQQSLFNKLSAADPISSARAEYMNNKVEAPALVNQLY